MWGIPLGGNPTREHVGNVTLSPRMQNRKKKLGKREVSMRLTLGNMGRKMRISVGRTFSTLVPWTTQFLPPIWGLRGSAYISQAALSGTPLWGVGATVQDWHVCPTSISNRLNFTVNKQLIPIISYFIVKIGIKLNQYQFNNLGYTFGKNDWKFQFNSWK